MAMGHTHTHKNIYSKQGNSQAIETSPIVFIYAGSCYPYYNEAKGEKDFPNFTIAHIDITTSFNVFQKVVHLRYRRKLLQRWEGIPLTVVKRFAC